MIKRIAFSTAAIVMAFVLQGRTLTPQEALSRIEGDRVAMKRVGGMDKPQPRLVHTATTSIGAAAVYVFDRPDDGGYLVVSADDVAAPLLGYADGGDASGEMPPQMKWWLSQYAAEIEHASETGSLRYVGSASDAGYSAQRKSIAPLLATRWDQSAPYNNDCPAISTTMPNGKAPTGCVATAMAQVMKYFNWPEKGAGTGNATDSSGKKYTMDLGVAFSWADMADSYAAGSYSATQASAVALLMKACGYAVDMNYGSSESGASSAAIPSALVDHFGYDAGAHLCMRDYYGRQEWEEMIYENLANVGPVLYTGATNLGGGHAFVCDGYSADGYFHFNWGWSGMYNGYYLLTALNPDGQGIGGYAGGYNMWQDVVLGIRKPTGQPVTPQPFRLTMTEAPTGEVNGNMLSLSGAWYNAGQQTVTAVVGARFEKVGATGNGAVQYVNLGEVSLDAMQGWRGLDIPYGYASLTDGTYKVSLVTRNGSEWLEALHMLSVPDYVLLTKKGNAYTAADVAPAHFTVSGAKMLTPLYYGKAAKMTFTVTNNSDMEIAGAVAPALLTAQSSPVALGECVFLDLLPGESSNEELVFTMQYTKQFEVGKEYEFVLYNPCDNSIYGSLGQARVSEAPSNPSLTCQSFTLSSGNPVADKTDMRFSATVKCTAGYLASPLMLVIFEESNGQYVNVSQTFFEDYLFLDAGLSATTEARLDFSQGSAGVRYLAAVYNPYVTGTPLSTIPFAISQSGVDRTSAEVLSIVRPEGGQMALVTSPAKIERVTVVGIDGRQLPAEVAYDGNSAAVDLSGCGRGVVVITATDAGGDVATVKTVL